MQTDPNADDRAVGPPGCPELALNRRRGADGARRRRKDCEEGVALGADLPSLARRNRGSDGGIVPLLDGGVSLAVPL
jgi:hypothetical protein